MSEKPARKWQIYIPAEHEVPRLFKDLAVEIGLNESILLMQIAYWIKISNNEVNGVYWTYQSLRGMQEKAFPYWSVETIRRTIESLKKSGYILVGNHNKRRGDKTQWFALEPEKLSSLKALIVLEVNGIDSNGGVSKRDTVSQNVTGVSQNVTALPEDTPEDTQKKNHIPLTPKGGKGRKRKTELTDHATWLTTEYAPHRALAEALRAPFLGMDVPPENSTRASLMPYLEAARELSALGASAEDAAKLYSYVKKRAADEQWKVRFGVNALLKHYPEWRAQQQRKAKQATAAAQSAPPQVPILLLDYDAPEGNPPGAREVAS